MTSVIVLLGASAAATPLARHQYRAAIAAIEAVLEIRDEPLWYARLGTAHARLGHYDEALTAFALGVGSPFYEREGWRDHADVLRATGQCAAAAELRASFELAAADAASLWADVAEDWLACGDHRRAWAAIASAEARRADHPVVHAVVADLLRAEGHLTEAGYHVDQALSVDAGGDIRPVLSSVAQRMRTGDLVGADNQLRTIVVGHMRDPRVFLARTELWLRTGQLAEARALAGQGPWTGHEDARVVERRAVIDERQSLGPTRSMY